MKRPFLATLLMLLAVCLFAAAGWMLFMSSLNSQVTTVTFRVSGSIDEVEIYEVPGPVQPVEVIRTGGQDIIQKVRLQQAEEQSLWVQSDPASYVFVTRSGSREYRSSPFCCETGMKPDQMDVVIHSLDNWEIASQ